MPHRDHRPGQILLAAALALAAAGRAEAQDEGRPAAPALSADWRAALDRISADSLRGHLSFLASDLLEGRGTPSRGLDIAAEYIAAQFRRAGLEPAGDDGYFQTARWRVAEPDAEGFSLEVRLDDQTIRVGPGQVSLSRPGPLDVERAPLIKVDALDAEALAALDVEKVAGRVVVTDIPDPRREGPSRRNAAARDRQKILDRLGALKAALIVRPDRDPDAATGLGAGRLIDPEEPRGGDAGRPTPAGPPVLAIHHPEAVRRLDALPAGPAEATLSLHLGAPVERPVKLRNVVGLLRGSDPALKETYVLVTAHYDHLGVGTPVAGDRVYNGANDDGSGTASVVELASTLATLRERPRRSLVFLTFFGEERGLLGSRYYARHPAVPIARTVADVNLEQVGRTDSSEGPQVATASLTGIDYSDVGAVFRRAGEAEGVRVYKHPRNSDAYFGASDNRALAELGVPAHTLCVSYAYPDYHGVGDHWDKVDYANMAKVDRLVARALLMIADDPEPPKWDAANSRARRYLKAHDERQGR
jgi:hypothetical protein